MSLQNPHERYSSISFTQEEWSLQNFRDCNGASNGIELPDRCTNPFSQFFHLSFCSSQFNLFFSFLSQLVSVVYFVWSGCSSPILSDWHEHWALIFSVLELENALGGDPGPGLGADSDFDKRQLEKVKLSWLAVRHQTDVIVMID